MHRHSVVAALAVSIACPLVVPALAGSVDATVGEITANVQLPKEVFTGVPLPDLAVSGGASVVAELIVDVEVQGNVAQQCQIITQLMLDGARIGNQTIDQLASSGTIDIRLNHVAPAVPPGTHSEVAQAIWTGALSGVSA